MRISEDMRSTLPRSVQTKKDYHALLAREKEERVAQSKKMDEEVCYCARPNA
jgi:hypothetical protein